VCWLEPWCGDLLFFFLYGPSQVRRYLHVVLCFSPVGDAFRERLRKFPSLVTCTTIDWWVPPSSSAG
jgi:dynein heavy chain